MIILKILLCVFVVILLVKWYRLLIEEHEAYIRSKKLECSFYELYLFKNGYYYGDHINLGDDD